MSDASEPTQRKHSGLIPFQPGQSGNPAGRPKGSRNKLGEAFVAALHDDFTKNGIAAIERVRTEDPAAYVRVIASILPRQVEIKEGAFDGVSDDELAALVAAARSALGVSEGGGAGSDQAGESEPAQALPAIH
jgi:hypothetical protein